MAHVPLNPIGNERDTFLDEQEIARNSEFIAELKATLTERREEVATGWGEKYQQRVHAKGKLTARERIELLKDGDSDIFEVGTFVNYGRKFDAGGKELASPGAGVVTCFIKVEGRWVVAIANDNTVASGSW